MKIVRPAATTAIIVVVIAPATGRVSGATGIGVTEPESLTIIVGDNDFVIDGEADAAIVGCPNPVSGKLPVSGAEIS